MFSSTGHMNTAALHPQMAPFLLPPQAVLWFGVERAQTPGKWGWVAGEKVTRKQEDVHWAGQELGDSL